jgi:ribonuclease R
VADVDARRIGRVAEVLGDIDAPGVDTEIIIRKHGIPDALGRNSVPRPCVSGARVEKDIKGRTDFRDIVDRHDRR